MKYVLLALVCLCMFGCGLYSETISKIEISSEVSDKPYIGLMVDEAQALAKEKGVSFRIGMKDGQAFPVTMDYRPGRITATVEQGRVVGYTVE